LFVEFSAVAYFTATRMVKVFVALGDEDAKKKPVDEDEFAGGDEAEEVVDVDKESEETLDITEKNSEEDNLSKDEKEESRVEEENNSNTEE